MSDQSIRFDAGAFAELAVERSQPVEVQAFAPLPGRRAHARPRGPAEPPRC